jgi:hypothetical protein
MVGIVLCWETGITVFEVRKLGNLVQFGFVTKIGDQENVKLLLLGKTVSADLAEADGLLLEKMIPVLLGNETKDASRSSYTSLVICCAFSFSILYV